MSKFDGRIDCAQLLITSVIYCLMVAVLLSLAILVGRLGVGDGRFAINPIVLSASFELGKDASPKVALFLQILTVPLAVAFAWAYAAVSIKRLHNSNWWMIPYFVAVGIIGTYGQFGDKLSGNFQGFFFGFATLVLFEWSFSTVSTEFLVSLKGRINLVKYWYAAFASITSCLVFMSILALAIGRIFGAGLTSVRIHPSDVFNFPPSLPFHASFANSGPMSSANLWFDALATPIFVAGIWFFAAATVKRLHDRNRSNWLIVPLFIAPLLLFRLQDLFSGNFVAFVIGIYAYGLSGWCFVELFYMPGARSPNRFGPDPLAPAAAATALRKGRQSGLPPD